DRAAPDRAGRRRDRGVRGPGAAVRAARPGGTVTGAWPDAAGPRRARPVRQFPGMGHRDHVPGRHGDPAAAAAPARLAAVSRASPGDGSGGDGSAGHWPEDHGPEDHGPAGTEDHVSGDNRDGRPRRPAPPGAAQSPVTVPEGLVTAIVNLVNTGPVELGAYTTAELTAVDAI